MSDTPETVPSDFLTDRDDARSTNLIIRDAVLKLWDVVDELTKLRPMRTDDYNVTIFGSARIQPKTSQYEEIRRLAGELARLGCNIITGGGPGLMQAANEGAMDASPENPERSIGIRVDLGFEQATNAFVGHVYQHKTFFSRLHHFVLQSNAFVVVPGGIGTTLETMMVWQLLQVHKLYDTPLVLVGPMWADLVAWARTHMIDGPPRLADPVDMTIPTCVEHIDHAIEVLRAHHQKWICHIKRIENI